MRLPRTESQLRTIQGGPSNAGGHRLLCWKCAMFQLHKASQESNGEVSIVLECTVCHTSDRFVYKAEMWIHEAVIPILDMWVDQIVENATGLRFEQKADGWHAKLGKEPKATPVVEKRHLLKHGKKEEAVVEQPKEPIQEVIVGDEFEG